MDPTKKRRLLPALLPKVESSHDEPPTVTNETKVGKRKKTARTRSTSTRKEIETKPRSRHLQLQAPVASSSGETQQAKQEETKHEEEPVSKDAMAEAADILSAHRDEYVLSWRTEPDQVPESPSEDQKVEQTTGSSQKEDSNMPRPIHSIQINRMQLRQRFYDLYFGGGGSNASPVFGYEHLDSSNPKTTAMTVTMDALCVAQIATSFYDLSLQKTARVMYNMVLRFLDDKIKTLVAQALLPDPAQLEDLMGSLFLLNSCAWYCCMGAKKGDWMHYAQGPTKLIRIFGWDKMRQPMRQKIWKYQTGRSFWNALNNRHAYKLAAPPTGVQPVSWPEKGSLQSYTYEVPSLLERTDALLANASSTPKDKVYAALLDLGNLVAALKRWHLDWLADYPPPYRMTSVKTYKDFRTLSQHHHGVFPTAYTFSSTRSEMDFRVLNLCLLALSEAIIDLHSAFPKYCGGDVDEDEDADELAPQAKAAEWDAASSAEALCMLVPWTAQSQNMTWACTYSLMPLQYATVYFERYTARGKGMQQLGWCRQVRAALVDKYGLDIDFLCGIKR